MAENHVQVPRDGAGKKVRTTTTIIDGGEVHQEVIQSTNATSTIINPSTEEKQDEIITGIPIKTLGSEVSVNNPLPTDGDSVYLKDIDISNSVLDGFSGSITDIFDSASTSIINSSANNPKSYTVYFKRPITTSEITIASGQGGTFSNAKLFLYDIAGNELLSIDNSTDNTQYTKYVFNNVPQTFIGYKIEFHTVNEINIAFNYIHKSNDVQANIKMVDLDSGLL